MHSSHAPLPRLFLTLALLLCASAASAQTRIQRDWDPNGWISVGFGKGANTSSSTSVLAGVASAWYTMGPFAGGLRASTGSPLFSGEGVDDVAAMVGLRTQGRRAFLLGALGYSSAHSYRNCDGPCSAQRSDPNVSALAFSAQAIANLRYVGIGAEVFGAAGPGRAKFHAAVITLQLGWFGE